MTTLPISAHPVVSRAALEAVAASTVYEEPDPPTLEQAFRRLVGQVFYGELIKALRRTVKQPAYLDGGMAETLMQGQLDQHLIGTFSNRLEGPWLQTWLDQSARRWGVDRDAAPLHIDISG
ncbi:MAG: hypothetical protein KatS3mg114_0421 [Planctomycetaceae bacterium]|nr:MAG: hypothetical protein KatS3mg114_0421 [Planctomycetaceae bacterium]